MATARAPQMLLTAFEAATPGTLATVVSTTFTAGQLAFVDSLKAIFMLTPSTVAVRTGIRIAASGLAGYQWVRQLIRNPIWEMQATWTIDPTNSTGLASDDNSGVDSSAPLLTYTEHCCRLANAEIAQATTTTVLGTQQAGDNPTYTFWVRPGIIHTFQGVGTVLYTSTCTGFTAMSNGVAAIDDAQFVDSAIPGGSFTAAGTLAKGIILKRTNGTLIYAYVLKDLGSTTARVSQPFNPLSSLTQPAFVNGDTYQAIQLPQISSIRFADSFTLGTKFDSFDWRVNSSDMPPFTNNCYFSTLANVQGRTNQAHLNACFDTGTRSYTGIFTITCGCFKGSGTSRQSFLGNLNTEANIICFQGASILPSVGNWNAKQVNFFDCTAVACVQSDTSSRAHFLSVINGKGNTGKVLYATEGTQIVWSGAATPFLNGITSDGTPYRAGSTVSASPILLQADMNGVFQTGS